MKIFFYFNKKWVLHAGDPLFFISSLLSQRRYNNFAMKMTSHPCETLKENAERSPHGCKLSNVNAETPRIGAKCQMLMQKRLRTDARSQMLMQERLHTDARYSIL